MERAFASLVAGTDAQTAETVAKLRTEYQALRQNPSATRPWKTWPRSGKESDLFRFDRKARSLIRNRPTPPCGDISAKLRSWGIPWKARVPLDLGWAVPHHRQVHKGTGLMASLKRTGMKFGTPPHPPNPMKLFLPRIVGQLGKEAGPRKTDVGFSPGFRRR